VNEKKVSLPTEKEAESLTGLEAGGISPLALINSGFQVLIDQQANDLGVIHISGGERGVNLRLGTKDLVQLTRARFGNISIPMDKAGDLKVTD
jgi:Cys-tRNA(Pro)/Cys-tRNA(Cys) deacylase